MLELPFTSGYAFGADGRQGVEAAGLSARVPAQRNQLQKPALKRAQRSQHNDASAVWGAPAGVARCSAHACVVCGWGLRRSPQARRAQAKPMFGLTVGLLSSEGGGRAAARARRNARPPERNPSGQKTERPPLLSTLLPPLPTQSKAAASRLQAGLIDGREITNAPTRWERGLCAWRGGLRAPLSTRGVEGILIGETRAPHQIGQHNSGGARDTMLAMHEDSTCAKVFRNGQSCGS